MQASAEPRLPLEVITRIAAHALDDDKDLPYPCWTSRRLGETCDGCKLCMPERVRRLAPFRLLNRQINTEVKGLVSDTLLVDLQNLVEVATTLLANVEAGQGGLYHRIKRVILDTKLDLRPYRDTLEPLADLFEGLAGCPNLTEIQIPSVSHRHMAFPLELSLVKSLPAPSLARLTSFTIWQNGWWWQRTASDMTELMTLITQMTSLVELKLSGQPDTIWMDYAGLPSPPKTLQRLTLGLSHGLPPKGVEWLVGDGVSRPIPTLILDATSDCDLDVMAREERRSEYFVPFHLVTRRIRRLELHGVSPFALGMIVTRDPQSGPCWPSLESAYFRTPEAFLCSFSEGTYLVRMPVIKFLKTQAPALKQVDFDLVVTRTGLLGNESASHTLTKAHFPIPRGSEDDELDANVTVAMVGFGTEQEAWEQTPRFCFDALKTRNTLCAMIRTHGGPEMVEGKAREEYVDELMSELFAYHFTWWLFD